jgi:hypothetical protein
MSDHDERRPELALRVIATLCAPAGSCPTIYRTDRGTLVIQGAPLSAEAAGIDLPEGEILVEIPEGLLNPAESRQDTESASSPDAASRFAGGCR